MLWGKLGELVIVRVMDVSVLWGKEANTSFTRILALRWDGGSTRAVIVVVRLAAGVVLLGVVPGVCVVLLIFRGGV